jgi:pimeloyl-CoA synthetase
MREEHIFVTSFCRQYLMGVLDSELTFFSDEAWFHLTGYISTQNSGYWSSTNLKQTLELPLHDQKIGVWCAITAT